jgi:3-dehydroquinate dehydratase-2
MKKVLVIHGPNLGLLGERETDVYGKTTLEEINQMIKVRAGQLGLNVDIFQSDHEGEIVAKIGKLAKEGFHFLIINPAAYTHTSVAIRDAVSAVKIPAIEVHLSNIHAREEFRQRSYVAPVAVGQISGFGPNSYVLAIEAVSVLAAKDSTKKS